MDVIQKNIEIIFFRNFFVVYEIIEIISEVNVLHYLLD